MVKGQASDKDRKGKEFQIIRNFNGNLRVEDYMEKLVKAHLEKGKNESRKEDKVEN